MALNKSPFIIVQLQKMANFKPFKHYLLILIDKLVVKHSMTGPFLDIGCGKGDVSQHFAKKGWLGKAIDISPEAIEVTKRTLSDHTSSVSIECADLINIDGKYNTILLCDVLEHIDDDDKFLDSIKMRSHNGTYVIISVPIFKREWQWDDEFYGHYRRYEVPELIQLLRKRGFHTLDMWDFTFPCFWFLRRVYIFLFPKENFLGDRRRSSLKRARFNIPGGAVS